MTAVLVTGGAGYIGSITAHQLAKHGYQVVVYDSLELGYPDRVKPLKLVQGRVQDQEQLVAAIRRHQIKAILHFAGYISMEESVRLPAKYFGNNTVGSLQLLQAMKQTDLRYLIFSSTAGVYGNPQQLPIPETHPTRPTNPYGQSKLMVEQMLPWFPQLKYAALRYFNAAGATPDSQLGEQHQPETHLIPNLINAALLNKPFQLYGTDYPTPDGTCVRDYIHVLDLAEAHIQALSYLMKGGESEIFNVGTGQGYSNLEVVSAVETVTQTKLKLSQQPRRPGDAVELVADVSKIKQKLNWEPKHSDLTTIIQTAYNWHSKLL